MKARRDGGRLEPSVISFMVASFRSHPSVQCLAFFSVFVFVFATVSCGQLVSFVYANVFAT